MRRRHRSHFLVRAPRPPRAPAPSRAGASQRLRHRRRRRRARTRRAPVDPGAPTEATLGFPIYPTAQFIASYDAGRGQRYYIFGATAPFAELVAYYRTV